MVWVGHNQHLVAELVGEEAEPLHRSMSHAFCTEEGARINTSGSPRTVFLSTRETKSSRPPM